MMSRNWATIYVCRGCSSPYQQIEAACENGGNLYIMSGKSLA